jgi:hypothetical protein
MARTIVALIVSMTIVRSAIIVIAPVALMTVTIFVATMLLVAQFTAMRGKKMSRFLLNASCLVGCLTLLKESNELERISRHHLVQVCRLELMHLGLHKDDLFTLLLCCGYFHCLTEVATLKIAEKLYSTPHVLVNWHESGLCGHTKPANQLAAYIGEPGNGLEVILDAFIEVCLHMSCIVWTLLCNDAGPFGQAYILKALTY